MSGAGSGIIPTSFERIISGRRKKERRISGISDETNVNFSESLRSPPSSGKKVALTRGKERAAVKEKKRKREEGRGGGERAKNCHFGHSAT